MWPASTALGCLPASSQGPVKGAAEVKLRGRLQTVLLRCGPGSKAWSVVTDGNPHNIELPTPELRKLAETLEGQDVVVTGQVSGVNIAVLTLKAAE
jgi:hypothetical protein